MRKEQIITTNNNQISLVFAMLGQSPVSFKGGGPWAVIEGIEPVFVAVGSSLVVLFFVIGFCSESINAGKQIPFQYYDYTGLKKKVLKTKGEVYKFSPYKLLWCGDYYYALGYSEKKSKVINFRVDRIASKPEILDKDIIPMDCSYSRKKLRRQTNIIKSS